MPIYEVVRRGKTCFQVAVCYRGRRKDMIVRGTRELAEKAERGLLTTLQIEAPSGPPRWSRVVRRGGQVSSDTFVYFIRAGENGAIKIGRAESAGQRLQYLQVGNAEELRLLLAFRAPHLIEKRLHNRFRHAHIRGEWFRPVSELLRLVDRLARRVAR